MYNINSKFYHTEAKMTVQTNRPKWQPKRDGYVAKILTWGMNPRKKEKLLNGNHDGCPMTWRFIFMFVWSLGGLRNDNVKPTKEKSALMVQINEKVSDFSETKAAEVIGKGIGFGFAAIGYLMLLAICAAVLFALGSMIYTIFTKGWTFAMDVGIVVGIVAGLSLFVYGLYRALRWIGSTEAWGLFSEKAWSLKMKMCPVVTFV